MSVRELAREFAYFDMHRSEWLESHLGKFALVHGEQHSFHVSYEEAYYAGLQTYGIEPFLIRRVMKQEEVHFVY